ncbi:helix-turn-helix domain-containing protein [Sinorhizobium meliloti]|nr:helix-turn-helix domain-containing protein [Sinorhizobium meliloti]
MHPLREWRLTQPVPLRQADIAEKLGISAVQVSRYETGRKRITAEKAVLIEKHFGIPRERLRPDVFATQN